MAELYSPTFLPKMVFKTQCFFYQPGYFGPLDEEKFWKYLGGTAGDFGGYFHAYIFMWIFTVALPAICLTLFYP